MRPREPVEPVVRFETPPKREGQVEFGTFTLARGGASPGRCDPVADGAGVRRPCATEAGRGA